MRLSELHAIGKKTPIGSYHFDADTIIRFASQFDPQPFHLDAEAAKDYVFGALCASGWHTSSAWMRCFVVFWKSEVARLMRDGLEPPKLGPSPGFRDLAWLKPVFAGDTVDFSVTLLECRELPHRTDRLLLTTEGEGINQKGEAVIRFKSNILEFV